MILPPIQSLMSIADQSELFPLPCSMPQSISKDFNQKHAIISSKQPPVKTKFTPYEDMMLTNIVMTAGCKNWFEVADHMKTRNARQCRDRWNNYLNPYLRNDPWTEDEDKLLLEKYKIYGTKWRKISIYFHNRSDNSIRNRFQILERKMNRQACSSPSNSSSTEQ